MFSYRRSTWALRQEFVEGEWTLDRCYRVEAIWNDDRKIRVIFSNVDIACDDEQPPKRSGKGAGAERACIGHLFSDLPRYAPHLSGEDAHGRVVGHVTDVQLSYDAAKYIANSPAIRL
jgi:hypothetical protein